MLRDPVELPSAARRNHRNFGGRAGAGNIDPLRGLIGRVAGVRVREGATPWVSQSIA